MKSKAQEYADWCARKPTDNPQLRDAEGGLIAQVTITGCLWVSDRYMSQEDALLLRDWLTDTFDTPVSIDVPKIPGRQHHRYLDGKTYDEDIVGEWQEEVVLPAMEIKRWGLVLRDNLSPQVISVRRTVYDTKEEAEINKDYYHEIVELTGTLPERKV